MKPSDLISQLRSLDIKLWVDGNRLRYKAPSGALTDELRAEVIKYKNEIIEFLQSDQNAECFDLSTIEVVPRDQTIPLSFAQQRLWFLHQLMPNSYHYNILRAFSFKGPLDMAALEQSLNKIIQRHEALRIYFDNLKGLPIQRIHLKLKLKFVFEDLRDLEPDDRGQLARQLANDEYFVSFDLSKGPLLRVKLLRLDNDYHWFLLTMHHIISDGWSMGVLFHELAVLYESYTKGRAPSLPELPIQYVDFAVWQRKWLSGQVLTSQLSYWKNQLSGELPVLDLPTDYPRPAIQTFNGARQSIQLSKELSESLKKVSYREHVTLFMTLLSAFKVLLHRYTGRDDIIVGSPTANRNRAEIESLIGFFANMLVLRSRVLDTQSFLDLLAQVREITLGAYTHHDLPFEKLVDELGIDRDLSRSALFQVVFALQNTPMEPLELIGLEVKPIETESQTTHFEFEVHVWEQDRRLRIVFTYNRDLFAAPTIGRMMNHYCMLLQGIVSNPECQISELPLLSETERQQLLDVWNRTQTEYPCDISIQELFELQAKKTPGSIAVVFKDQQATYSLLNKQANQLAHHLRSLGVSRGSLVGVCLERSIEMIVSMLGILKAGGAYVPLDVNYPLERLSFMLEDTGSNVLLTRKDLLDRFSDKDIQIVCLDRDKDMIGAQPVSDLEPKLCGDDLAYVMYTSGSTGIPKGVAVPHRGVVRLLFGVDYVHLGPQETLLQLAPISFDASTFEIWGALLHGGRCVLFPSQVPSAEELGEAIEHHGVSTLWLTASLFNMIISDAPQILKGLKQLLTGGEALSMPHIRQALKHLPSTKLINGYGPTENTTFTCCYPIPKQMPEDLNSIPIGRPIANTRVYVLDTRMEPVPVGVPGELYIGGDGLARGYINRPELTAEKFVNDPFSKDPDLRLYRTGDLVRWLPEGILEFLGRQDDQVKLRGFRIELGEIESVLSTHESVAEAVVLLREDEPGDKRLVGYVVPCKDASVPFGDIRAYLRQKLPDYMVPSYFVQLDSLPLTPNGKVDKQALPAPDRYSTDLSKQFTGPCSPIEQALMGIWKDVLKRDNIGINDNFFHIGGHSLLAMQVISRVTETFGVPMPVVELFEYPTLGEFASEIESKIPLEDFEKIPPIKPVERKAEMPLSFAQQRLWFLDQLEPANPSYNMPLALQLSGKLDISALQRSLDEIIHRHESLRTIFSTIEGQPKQCIIKPHPFELVKEDLSSLPASQRQFEAQRQAKREAMRPFDLARGPLVRGRLLKLDEHTHVLVLCMHHIVSDGWSLRLFFNELSAFYSAFSKDQPSFLPEIPVQYADFAYWQRQHLQDQVLERELAYWKKQLSDNPPPLELPTDKPRPAVQTYQGAFEKTKIDGPFLEQLRELSNLEQATLFMTMLAAFKALLYRYTGQKDILIGTPIAGRNRREIENLIGFFVNTLVLRTDLSGRPSFRTLLGRIRHTALEAFQHQELPFEKLVEELSPERDLSRNPLFQVFFNMVDLSDTKITLPPLKAEPFPLPLEFAKFDLSIYCFDEGDTVSLRINYSTDLFKAGTIKQMLSHYKSLLTAAVEDTDLPISVMPLFSKKERKTLKAHSNQIAPTNQYREFKHIEIEQTIVERFLEQVEQYPDRIAIKTPKQNWTYNRLNLEANRIAHAIDNQTKADCRHVALLLEHSPSTVAAMIGALKTGRAYVPLDPSYPQSRLAYIIQDSRAGTIITSSACIDSAHSLGDNASIINIDQLKTNAGPFSSSATPDSLAYILYTSGSTGQPKGVMQNHRNLLHHICIYTNSLHISQQDRLTFLSSYTFDGAVMDIYGAVLNGATLYPYNIREHGLIDLSAWLDTEYITIYHSTPSVYRYFIGMLDKDQVLPHLRLVVLGGEEVVRNDIELYKKHYAAHCLFVNVFGASESSLALHYFMNHDTKIERPSVPVGYSVAESKAILIDDEGQEVDFYGEIGIRSAHVALGYWQRPEMTKKAFLVNGDNASQRTYRTGDMGRMLPDGSMEFTGRKDSQVKIRGIRVEPGEIDTTLTKHPSVHQALTISREDIRGEKQLVTYIVASDGSRPSSRDLRNYLRQRLADYMIPAAYIVLETLPLTPNGKIDYRALPEPVQAKSESNYTAPRNKLEQELSDIWATLLQLERVSIYDNFFELGGQSLIATQVIARIQKALDVELSLRRFFQAPTIVGLAAAVEETRSADTAQHMPTIGRISRETYRIKLSSQKILENPDVLENTITESGEE